MNMNQPQPCQVALTPAHSPVPPNHPLLSQFPFTFPPYLNGQNAPELRSFTLQKAQIATSAQAVTTPATETQDLQSENSGDALVYVVASEYFWPNLVRYATGYPNAHHQHTTWNVVLPIPDAQQQIEAIRGLAAWYLFHMNRRFNIPEMNSEPSVQGEVLLQILEPINALLKTRYLPPAGHNHHNNGSPRYPCWGRGINAYHKDPGFGTNSGYPDFLHHRFGTPPENNNGATGEIKTWWSYPSRSLLRIFNDRKTVLNGVYANQSNVMSKLLLQMWGQLIHFNCHLGFWTNGERIMFIAKSGNGTLVLSEPRLWNDPEVHAAFAGLSFAANDINTLPMTPQIMIDQILCPDRRTSWWFLV